ncbi:hypothetical protein QVD17_29665 [Tagetes erecta]|uniref:Phytocyanin domain-containing protein n=1 Tax=Tagetes erecta TaxID=13708 RepID=A0AAD8NMR8_TARER|nr:hypothetical protein QVD17_29665 [Tagetes erecta]
MASFKLNFVFTTLLVACMHFSVTTAATSYLVGGAYGWIVPPKPNHYEEWRKGKKFVKGDVFHFIFKNKEHTLAIAKSKEAYDKCNTSAVTDLRTGSDAIWILYGVDVYYFICTLHCAKGQKVIIDIKAS